MTVIFRVLIICSFTVTLCGAVLPQTSGETNDADLKKQVDAIEKQQQLILDKLSELESKLSRTGIGTNVDLPSTTDIGGERFRGQPGARIAIIEYSDFECPFCGQYERESFPKILQNYIQTGKIRYLYRDLPLHHPHAMLAARASRCAGDQGKYWQMHDALFANQTNLAEQHLSELARAVGLDGAKFDNCLISERFTAEIQASASQANSLGLSATPSFVLGTLEDDGHTVRIEKRIVGAVPYDLFRADLDAALAGVSPPK